MLKLAFSPYFMGAKSHRFVKAAPMAGIALKTTFLATQKGRLAGNLPSKIGMPKKL